MKYCELENILEVGKVYTILSIDEIFGFARKTVIRLTKAEARSYAQHDDACRIEFNAKQKRFSSKIHYLYLYKKHLAIFEGDVSINTDPWGETSCCTKTGLIASTARYSSFDERFFTDALETVNESPIFIVN